MRKMIAGVLCALALAVSFALFGCANNDQYLENFTGTWDLSAVSASDGSVTESDVELMHERGLEASITLNADKTGTFNLFGSTIDLTWECTGESSATLSSDDGKATMQLKDGQLIMSDTSSNMTFDKRAE